MRLRRLLLLLVLGLETELLVVIHVGQTSTVQHGRIVHLLLRMWMQRCWRGLLLLLLLVGWVVLSRLCRRCCCCGCCCCRLLVVLLRRLVQLLGLCFDLPINALQRIANEHRAVQRLLRNLPETGEFEHGQIAYLQARVLVATPVGTAPATGSSIAAPFKRQAMERQAGEWNNRR